jgi:hypothetical protein
MYIILSITIDHTSNRPTHPNFRPSFNTYSIGKSCMPTRGVNMLLFSIMTQQNLQVT